MTGADTASGVGVEVVGKSKVGTDARRASVDGESRNEVIGVAADRVDRNPLRQGPREPVGGRGQQKIIGADGCGAPVLKPAIRPDNVHSTRRIDLGRRQRRSANFARMTVIQDLGRKDTSTPALATIGGPE